MKLKLCPFCKVPKETEIRGEQRKHKIKWYAECLMCLATGPVCESEIEAAQAWNRGAK